VPKLADDEANATGWHLKKPAEWLEREYPSAVAS